MSRARHRVRAALRMIAPRLRGLLGIHRSVDVRFVHSGEPARVTDEGAIEFDPEVCARLRWPVIVGLVVQEVFHALRGDHLLCEYDRRRRAKEEANRLTGRFLTFMRLPLQPMEAFLLEWCPDGDWDEHSPAAARIGLLRAGAAQATPALRVLR